MNIRSFLFYAVTASIFASLFVFPAVSAADEPNSLTKQVMSGSSQGQAPGSLKEEVQVTNTEKKKKEFQIDLGNELKAYISEGESPYGKDLNGKPLNGRYRTTFGFRIPL